MNKYLRVSFWLEQTFRRIHICYMCTWVRITENKVVLQFLDNSIKEFKLKQITEFEITTLY